MNCYTLEAVVCMSANWLVSEGVYVTSTHSLL
jgi:hypothetical protein